MKFAQTEGHVGRDLLTVVNSKKNFEAPHDQGDVPQSAVLKNQPKLLFSGGWRVQPLASAGRHKCGHPGYRAPTLKWLVVKTTGLGITLSPVLVWFGSGKPVL